MDAISFSIRYLEAADARLNMESDPYWPKWNSPWWHMSALFELGRADLIPHAAAEKLLAEIQRTHLPYFFREQAPAGKLPHQDAPCPCSLGNIYQILSATGVDLDGALPWARRWFLDYQMPDGGLNCDEEAYRAKDDPGASSLVGTIAPLEAILLTRDRHTPDEVRFLDRGAACLIERELRLGSRSRHNAEEREDETVWLELCFPRLYFYDVLRGLSFILAWAERLGRPLPWAAIAHVVNHLESRFPDGRVTLGRVSYDGVQNVVRMSSGERRREPASTFALLEELSRPGTESPALSGSWKEARQRLERLRIRGLVGT